MSEAVLYDEVDGVVTLTLNEPETRNAISPAIVDALVGHIERINTDMSVRCVIVTGAGDGFSSGGNVKQMRDREGMFGNEPVQIRRGYWYGIQRIPMAMYSLEVPAIAAVNGAAVGAGCDLSLMCDIRLANTKAVFAESFMRVGLVSGDGGAWFLPRVVGYSRAAEMTFTGDFVKAEEAERIGLVSRIVPDGRGPQARPPDCVQPAAQPAPEQAPAPRQPGRAAAHRTRNGLLHAGPGPEHRGPARGGQRLPRQARAGI